MNVKRNMLREQEQNPDNADENYHTKETSQHKAAIVNKTALAMQPRSHQNQSVKSEPDEEQPGDINLKDKNVVLNFGTVDIDDLGAADSASGQADGETQPSSQGYLAEEEKTPALHNIFHPSGLGTMDPSAGSGAEDLAAKEIYARGNDRAKAEVPNQRTDLKRQLSDNSAGGHSGMALNNAGKQGFGSNVTTPASNSRLGQHSDQARAGNNTARRRSSEKQGA